MIVPENIEQVFVVSNEWIIFHLYSLCVVPEASIGWIFFTSSSKSNTSSDDSLSTSKLSLDTALEINTVFIVQILGHLREPKSGHSK